MSEEELLAYVAARLDDGETIDDALKNRHISDLYLCCACARGDEAAIAAFRERFLPAIIHSVSRAAASHLVDEVTQIVMTKLFVSDGSKPPTIATYSGNGKLSTWVQVVARRQAHTGMRTEARRGANARAEDDIEQLLTHAFEGEEEVVAGLKQAYRERFKAAFRAAFAGLEPRERNLLRYECIDRLTRDQIAELYGVSRATVARWRAACRTKLFDETRRAFSESQQLDPTEFKSVMRLIESQLDVSLSRLLRTP